VISTDANYRTHIENVIKQQNQHPGKDKEGSVENPFQFVVQTLDESYFVLDKSGKKHRLAQIAPFGKCLLRTTKVPLTRTNYGSSSVIHGAGEFFGTPTQLAWIEDEDGSLKFGASVWRPEQ
jgi:hypothetical protein